MQIVHSKHEHIGISAASSALVMANACHRVYTELMTKSTLTIATRSSSLALWQAREAARQLSTEHPGLATSLLECKTLADRFPNTPVQAFGAKGVFVKELESALLSGQADLAVHSAKDLQAVMPDGLTLAAYLPRAAAEDVLWSTAKWQISQLPTGAVIGSSSPRRTMQLKYLRPDLTIQPIRGLVPTRIQKVERGQYDATILARAGLDRLAINASGQCQLSLAHMLPAAGQGAIAIQCRTDDRETRRRLAKINHSTTQICVDVERWIVRALGAHCQAPLAVYTRVDRPHLVVWIRAKLGTNQLFDHQFKLNPKQLESELNNIIAQLAKRGLNADSFGQCAD